VRFEQLIAVLAGLGAITWVLWYFLLSRRPGMEVTPALEGSREVTIVVHGGYEPSEIRARRGSRLRLVFDRREEASCSEEVVLPAFGIRRFLPAFARTVVEVTPRESGDFEFTCGMGMLRGRLIVTD
jgi:plastocyanin domain-containing protein